jgi:hypothetical protein
MVLPLRSELGEYQGETFEAKGAWPVRFVCSDCGICSEHLGASPQPYFYTEEQLANLKKQRCIFKIEISGSYASTPILLFTAAPASKSDEDLIDFVKTKVRPARSIVVEYDGEGKPRPPENVTVVSRIPYDF